MKRAWWSGVHWKPRVCIAQCELLMETEQLRDRPSKGREEDGKGQKKVKGTFGQEGKAGRVDYL